MPCKVIDALTLPGISESTRLGGESNPGIDGGSMLMYLFAEKLGGVS